MNELRGERVADSTEEKQEERRRQTDRQTDLDCMTNKIPRAKTRPTKGVRGSVTTTKLPPFTSPAYTPRPTKTSHTRTAGTDDGYRRAFAYHQVSKALRQGGGVVLASFQPWSR